MITDQTDRVKELTEALWRQRGTVVVPTPERYRYANCPFVAVHRGNGRGWWLTLWNGGPTSNAAVPLPGGWGVSRSGVKVYETKRQACRALARWLLDADPDYTLDD